MKQLSDPIHPGEHLVEFLDELGISQHRFAEAIGVPPVHIGEILQGKRDITADTALRFGRAFDMTPEFWLNLQQHYDLEVARCNTDVSRIECLVEPWVAEEVHAD